MPRKAKDEERTKLNTVKTKQARKSTTTKETSKIKSSTTKSKTEISKVISKKVDSKSTKKDSLEKNNTKTRKKASTTQNSSEASSKKASTRRPKTNNSARKVATTRKTSKKVTTLLEYYDLPAIYNKTIVKILAQTPSCLFVYWEISKRDKLELEKKYGNSFFNDTTPYLVIANETMNYSFEVEINDYANSWYIHINDSDCKYEVKLIRKPKNNQTRISVDAINIASSNKMHAPNDHILFDKLGKTVFFKNVKTNIAYEKNISSISFISNMGRIYNIYDFYKEIYKDELNGNEFAMKLSSSQFSSFFK